MKTAAIRAVVMCLGLVAAAFGQTQVLVTQDIAVSTTWTANNTYNLQQQIYVLPGASLTIQAGTVVASSPSVNGGGSLAVCRGAQIFVQGTQLNPVIMTSTNDTATWVGGNPHTGTWRAACNEWGNLTIMGAAYISENAVAANTATPNAANYAPMEGLVAAFPGDTKVLYGGGNDDDDSGSVSYLSLRYGGRVVGLNNELNGLSLGGIGRATEMNHVEIMNNVDDGVEIWGGTVNLKHVSIWNIGDDSLDIDQGYRGKIQFGLIVQGYSVGAAQGSGVGDNCIEMDGAEQSDYQPVTTTTLYNMTVIGQPGSTGGDHATAWRDNANAQLRNCVFMDLGERLVSLDNLDGDGGAGYGFNTTLSWASRWTTPYSTTSTVNAPANPAAFYTAQTSGNLCEIKDSVMFRNANAAAYTEANNRSVFAAANNNTQVVAVDDASMPVQTLTRAAPLNVFGTLVMRPVTYLDPRPKNEALTSVAYATQDGFFSSAHYRGAFAPGNNWLAGWTSTHAYGMTPADQFSDVGGDLAGVSGAPVLSGTGSLVGGTPFSLNLSNAAPSAFTYLAVGFTRLDLPFGNGTVVPDCFANGGFLLPLFTDANGGFVIPALWPMLPSNTTLYVQVAVLDAASSFGSLSLSNALAATTF